MGKRGNRWVVQFTDMSDPVLLLRKDIYFVSRPEAAATGAAAAPGATSASAVEEADSSGNEAAAPEVAGSDSSDPDDDASTDDGEQLPVGWPEHDGGVVDGHGGSWVRDDDYAVDERARHGFCGADGSRLNGLSDWQHASLFVLACHFLPMEFLGEMAVVMTAEGAKKAAACTSGYGGWNVTSGERSKYWEEPKGGFGPAIASLSILGYMAR
eukprot:6188998-Pleurochrysis_carterae.AAC.1